MKKLLMIAAAGLLVAGTSMAAKKTASAVERIDPPCWYAGMNDGSVQLMVYGHGIGAAEVSVDYAGVALDSLVRLDSPNYLLVYLNTAGAEPGNVPLTFTIGKKKFTVPYELRRRAMAGSERVGFDNTDVLYMLMPDRFADGNPGNNVVAGMRDNRCDRSAPSLRHGGDLEGLRQHLDYFSDLGVTALWFTPVLENDSPAQGKASTYHGYATTDYYRVDPRFGTNDDYRRLVDEAHARGIKIVMDMIFNHCGINHPWIDDIPAHDWFNLAGWLEKRDQVKNPRDAGYEGTSYKLTPVRDPYASKIDLKETVDGWFVPGMPDLNQNNPHVMNYLIQNSIWWIETVGIDGIRMDTYPYAFEKPMARWMKRLDSEYPRFNVVGETWVTEPAYTAAWQKGSKLSEVDSYLPTVMDFAFYDRINQAKHEETDAWWGGYNRIYNSLVYDFLYPNPKSVMAFVENHDTDRFLASENYTDAEVLALKQALALLLTMNRTPQLYYGTEVLMAGNKQQTDGDVRRDFPGGFAGDKKNAFTGQGMTAKEMEMHAWLKRLLQWRKGNKVITEGRQTQFIPFNGVYALARQLDGKTVLTVVNGTSRAATMDVARYAEVIGNHTIARDVTSGTTVDLSHNLNLSPRQVLVLEF